MSERWHSELTRRGAQFSDGRVASFASGHEGSFATLQDGAILCDLSHLGLMLATGEDAAAKRRDCCSNSTSSNQLAKRLSVWFAKRCHTVRVVESIRILALF